MKHTKSAQAALDELLDSVDYVIESYETPDYKQLVCSTGGDVCTYRIYEDGRVGCK